MQEHNLASQLPAKGLAPLAQLQCLPAVWKEGCLFQMVRNQPYLDHLAAFLFCLTTWKSFRQMLTMLMCLCFCWHVCLLGCGHHGSSEDVLGHIIRRWEKACKYHHHMRMVCSYNTCLYFHISHSHQLQWVIAQSENQEHCPVHASVVLELEWY